MATVLALNADDHAGLVAATRPYKAYESGRLIQCHALQVAFEGVLPMEDFTLQVQQQWLHQTPQLVKQALAGGQASFKSGCMIKGMLRRCVSYRHMLNWPWHWPASHA